MRFLWEAAPHCSFVHDVGARGIADIEVPEGARAVLACTPGDVGKLDGMELVEIGVVG